MSKMKFKIGDAVYHKTLTQQSMIVVEIIDGDPPKMIKCTYLEPQGKYYIFKFYECELSII